MTNTVKAPKVTLNSIVFAAAPVLPALAEGETAHAKEVVTSHKTELATFIENQGKALAHYLLGKTTETDTVLAIFKSAVKVLPTVQAEILKAEEEEKAKIEAKRIEDAEAEEKARKQAAEALEAKKAEMLELLTNSGVDLVIAKAMVEAGLKTSTPASAKNAYERVNCTIDGVSYDVPVRGNMSQVLKDLAVKYGFADNREAFIEKFKTVAAETSAE